jgi:hypothetical protein
MKALSAILFVSLVLWAPALSAEEGFKFRKNPKIEQVRPKKPVQIKLKRLKGGKYTWEITGYDAEEILKADEKLRKSLKMD